jgi:hypothetical protein
VVFASTTPASSTTTTAFRFSFAAASWISTRSDEPSSNGIVVPETRAQMSCWLSSFGRPGRVGLLAELVLEQQHLGEADPAARERVGARARVAIAHHHVVDQRDLRERGDRAREQQREEDHDHEHDARLPPHQKHPRSRPGARERGA